MPNKNLVEVELQLYYANWCGYCVRFKPTWEIIKENMPKDKDLKNVTLLFHECEDSAINNDEKAKDVEKSGFKIKSYPTLLLKLNNKYIQFPSDNRDYEVIKKFILCKTNQGDCLESNTQNSEHNQQGGKNNVDYRKKYKKYKELYKGILIKYSELKKNNK